MSKIIPITPARRRKAEEKTAYTRLLAEYTQELQPTTAHEEFLVQQMARARQRLNRAMAIANALPDPPELVDRYVASAQRSFDLAHRELLLSRKSKGRKG